MNVLDPAVIVIGGGLVEAADLLLPEVRRRFADLVMAGERRPPIPIVPAQLGERAGAIGAALLAVEPRCCRHRRRCGLACRIEHSCQLSGHADHQLRGEPCHERSGGPSPSR